MKGATRFPRRIDNSISTRGFTVAPNGIRNSRFQEFDCAGWEAKRLSVFEQRSVKWNGRLSPQGPVMESAG